MIRLSSRYADGEILFIRDPKTGNTVPTVLRTVVPSSTHSIVHRWKDGDRVDILGKTVEDKAHLWWKIFDQNSEYIDPLTVPHGASVVIR